jgi:hypothetical protein
MTKFTFDGVEHDLDSLPQEARGHVTALQFIDAELHKHAMSQASLQTARTIYSNALREAIAGPGAGPGNGAHDSKSPPSQPEKAKKKKGFFS